MTALFDVSPVSKELEQSIQPEKKFKSRQSHVDRTPVPSLTPLSHENVLQRDYESCIQEFQNLISITMFLQSSSLPEIIREAVLQISRQLDDQLMRIEIWASDIGPEGSPFDYFQSTKEDNPLYHQVHNIIGYVASCLKSIRQGFTNLQSMKSQSARSGRIISKLGHLRRQKTEAERILAFLIEEDEHINSFIQDLVDLTESIQMHRARTTQSGPFQEIYQQIVAENSGDDRKNIRDDTEAQLPENTDVTVLDSRWLDNTIPQASDVAEDELEVKVPSSKLTSILPYEKPISRSVASSRAIRSPTELSRRFCYRPFQIGENLRLLTLHAGPRMDKIECSLANTSTFEQPAYEALSYTWGTDSTTHEISIRDCNECLHIRTILFEALKTFRRLDRDIVLWVDALCINQEDHEEKSRQISILPTIFMTASNVLIWLGVGNMESDVAITFIPQILDLSRFDTLITSEQYGDRWRAFAKLLGYRYFSRRWIVQDVALAKEAVIHCGDATVRWTDFADAVTLFISRYDEIKTLVNSSKRLYDDGYYLEDVPNFEAKVLVNIVKDSVRRADDGLVERLYTLEMLVSSLANFRTSEPRDVIYSLLSLAKDIAAFDQDETNHTWKPDYTKPTIELYRDFIEFCINSSNSLDILCRPWVLGESKWEVKGSRFVKWDPWYLPSWVSRREDPRSPWDSLAGLPGHRTYNASKSTSPSIRFSSNDTKENQPSKDLKADLKQAKQEEEFEAEAASESRFSLISSSNPVSGSIHVKGFQLDSVESLSSPIGEGVIPQEVFIMSNLTAIDDASSDNIPEALWRTLVADRDPYGRKPPSWYRRACIYCLAFKNHAGDLNTEDLIRRRESSPVVTYLKRVQLITRNRRFLRTANKNLIGLAPSSAREGDLICILFGCSVPVILRPIVAYYHEGFQLVGECYVHGIMDGEAMDGEWEEQEFEIW